MNTATLTAGIALVAVIGLAIYFLITWRRHQKDYREHLEPILNLHGLQFVNARWPGFFKVGPFPKFEVETGRPQSRALGISGEFDEYRIVTFRDSDSQTHDVWALLEFEMFRLRGVRWRAENSQDLPGPAKAMLEV